MSKEKSKSEKFTELAEQRMTKAIGSLRALRKLANKAAYEYTDKQVTAIVESLTDEVKTIAGDFKAGKASRGDGFKF